MTNQQQGAARRRQPGHGTLPPQPEGQLTLIRVLIVDDHAFVREASAALLGSAEGIAVVGQCADGAEVLEAAAKVDPHVVLMDVEMPITSGLAATRQLIAAWPAVRVLILTGSAVAASPRAAEEAGAVGYLTKGGDPQRLLEAVRAVAAGGTAWPAGFSPT